MATRTNEDLVGEVIEVNAAISVDPFILAASSLVDVIAQAIADDPDSYPESSTEGMTWEERLELIETWLAAHFYAVRDPRRTQEGVGSVQEQFQSKVDLGLNVTHYGQQAMLLDTTGTLRAMATGSVAATARRAGVYWVGTEIE